MSEDYTLKYTGAFGKSNKNKIKPKTIDVSGDCVISNFDTRTNNKPVGALSIFLEDGKIKINESSKNDETSDIADFSEKKAEILEKIAMLDGDKTLSVKDILKLKKDLIKKWAIKDLRFDYNQGVVTVVFGENDILRIDFSKQKNDNAITTNRVPTNNVPTNNALTNSTPTNNISTNSVESKNNLLEQVFDRYLPKEYDSYIKNVAQRTGVSEDFVKFLMFTEGNSKNKFKPVLKAYKDSKGILTIGLGHTNSPGTYKFDSKTEITTKEAFEILVKDIEHHKDSLFRAIGEEEYNKIKKDRKTLAYALIDWSFNAGTKRFYNSENVKINIKEKNYFGLATTSLFNEGDARRSFYRMAFAVSYMDDKNRNRVAQEFLNKEMKTEKMTYKQFILSNVEGEEKKYIENIINSCIIK